MGTNQWSPSSPSGGGGVTQIAYVEFTSNVTVSSTTEGTPTDVVDSPAHTYDGATLICIEFFAPQANCTTASGAMLISLWDGAANLGRLGATQESAASGLVIYPLLLRRFLTPSAASHTYKIQAFCTAAAAGTIGAGSGGSGNNLPGYIRVTSGS